MFKLYKRVYECSKYKLSQNLSTFANYRTKFTEMEPRELYVCHNPETNKVYLNFKYVNELNKINREFNFVRSCDENLSVVLLKICEKIEKITKKKNNKNPNPTTPTIVKLVKKLKMFECSEIDDSDSNIEILALYEYDNHITSDSDDVQESKQMSTSNPSSQLTCVQSFVENASDNMLVIDDYEFILNINPPKVEVLKLPTNIMAGFCVSPTKLKTVNCILINCQFIWFKSEQKLTDNEEIKTQRLIKWRHTGSGYYMKPSTEDIGHVLKLVITPKNGTKSGREMEVVSSVLVSAGPGECPFQRRHLFTEHPSGQGRMRVVTYNILADLYADSDYSRDSLFSTCPHYALHIDYRKQLLISEILGYKADLLCMQEVGKSFYAGFLEPILGSQGYDGVFAQKNRNVGEGSSIVYLTDKFKKLEDCRFVICDELQTNPLFSEVLAALEQDQTLKETIITKSNILQVMVLESIDCPSRLIVCGTTHLYFFPIADHIRMLQGGICMGLLRQVMALYQAKFPDKDVGLIFTGDFNSCPENAIYRFMKTQLIDVDDPDWCSDPEHSIKGVKFSHDLEMDSACGTPPYTNYVKEFNGCLDYIYYQRDKFSVEMTVPMPTHEEVTANEALPSVVFPSDHIALITDLSIINTKQ